MENNYCTSKWAKTRAAKKEVDDPYCDCMDEIENNDEEKDYCTDIIKCLSEKDDKMCSCKIDKDNITVSDDPLFPKDLFEEEQLKGGAIILHIIGVVYMFYALALVCDEFFVPSLDVIIEKLGIGQNIAGATFMAAGGSAPELFTSIIGVFIAKSDVGIGTIVGSAVFNILFVIAACAFAAKEALSLTAWPLIRDVFFYSISLILLVSFASDNNIHWYEALILFLWYFAYVGFMKINDQTELALRKLLKLEIPPKEAEEERSMKGSMKHGKHQVGLFCLMTKSYKPEHQFATNSTSGGMGGLKSLLQQEKTTEDPEKPTAENLNNEKSEENEPKPEGNKESSNSISVNIEPKENDDKTPANEDKKEKKEDEKEKKEDKKDKKEDDTEKKENETEKKEDEKENEEENEPIDLSFATAKEGGAKGIIFWAISLPLMGPMWLTLPDTKDEKRKKFFVITFIGSIIWIAAFSYLMVWWTTTIGDTVGIPPAVMGLTFLAAGTSVPDLITSVLVAQQGHGDMAVSSSVGSNIFDVTVGLPFPWLLYTAISYPETIKIESAGVGCDMLMLFSMLIAVFLLIIIFKWKMTKAMGMLMAVLYFIFVVVSLGFKYCWYVCPI